MNKRALREQLKICKDGVEHVKKLQASVKPWAISLDTIDLIVLAGLYMARLEKRISQIQEKLK